MNFHAFAAHTPGARLKPFAYEPQPLGPFEVEILITHCGICHSDVHLVDGDWGEVHPVVPGHEIIGMVEQAGPHAIATPGWRVGAGWQRGSCGICPWCRSGGENMCPASQATCMGHFGGFADRIRIDSRFVFRIPDALSSAETAPLLCGGATVYTPLRRHARPWMRVGVIGVGGLGHLALQFASRMGCEVTAFSRKKDKEKQAREFGAHHFCTKPSKAHALDVILNTSNAGVPYEDYIQLLRPEGVLVQLGADPAPIAVGAMPLIIGNRSLCGSAIGSPAVIREMLEFAARHGIRSQVELRPMRDCHAALDRTRKNRARFRMVLEN